MTKIETRDYYESELPQLKQTYLNCKESFESVLLEQNLNTPKTIFEILQRFKDAENNYNKCKCQLEFVKQEIISHYFYIAQLHNAGLYNYNVDDNLNIQLHDKH
jgi:hypothetical protein